jgi:hypothetical protein
MLPTLLCVLAPTLGAPRAFAQAEAGTRIEAPILKLRPTQFNLGMIEVRSRADKMRRMPRAELQSCIDGHPAPVAVGPGGAFYIFDRHHFARALLEIGETRMVAVIKADWSGLSEDEFWRRMSERQWVWLYDEGRGPLRPSELPGTVAEMTDDPYRSLARAVRKAGGWRKSSVPFAEFQWADYLRPRISRGMIRDEFNKAVEEGIVLAHAPAAESLPGYAPAGGNGVFRH